MCMCRVARYAQPRNLDTQLLEEKMNQMKVYEWQECKNGAWWTEKWDFRKHIKFSAINLHLVSFSHQVEIRKKSISLLEECSIRVMVLQTCPWHRPIFLWPEVQGVRELLRALVARKQLTLSTWCLKNFTCFLLSEKDPNNHSQLCQHSGSGCETIIMAQCPPRCCCPKKRLYRIMYLKIIPSSNTVLQSWWREHAQTIAIQVPQACLVCLPPGKVWKPQGLAEWSKQRVWLTWSNTMIWPFLESLASF
jgi:hypothetical protein